MTAHVKSVLTQLLQTLDITVPSGPFSLSTAVSVLPTGPLQIQFSCDGKPTSALFRLLASPALVMGRFFFCYCPHNKLWETKIRFSLRATTEHTAQVSIFMHPTPEGKQLVLTCL